MTSTRRPHPVNTPSTGRNQTTPLGTAQHQGTRCPHQQVAMTGIMTSALSSNIMKPRNSTPGPDQIAAPGHSAPKAKPGPNAGAHPEPVRPEARPKPQHCSAPRHATPPNATAPPDAGHHPTRQHTPTRNTSRGHPSAPGGWRQTDGARLHVPASRVRRVLDSAKPGRGVTKYRPCDRRAAPPIRAPTFNTRYLATYPRSETMGDLLTPGILLAEYPPATGREQIHKKDRT